MAGPPQWKISSAYPKRQDPGDLPCTLRATTARVRSSPATGRVAASALSAPAAARVPKWLQGEQGSKAVAEHKRTQAPGTSRAYLTRESCPEALRRLQRLGIQQDVVFDCTAADGSTRVQEVCFRIVPLTLQRKVNLVASRGYTHFACTWHGDC